MGLEDVYVFSDNVLAPDGVTRISASKRLDRELRRDRRMLDPDGRIEAAREGRQKNIGLIPLDEQGRAMCWCGECLMWQRREAFGRDVLRGGKPRRVCKTCEAAKERIRYAQEARDQGRQVRTYKRQLVQMSDGG